MTVLKVGVMPREQFQRHMLDIASGKYKPKRGDPKIWFSSMKSLSEVLSDNNVRLLKLIKNHNPETIKELAEISGRQTSNLSRTLKTMERYGIVELRRKNKSVKPIAKATAFTIQYAAS
jgi:predicted transcriptional regulator